MTYRTFEFSLLARFTMRRVLPAALATLALGAHADDSLRHEVVVTPSAEYVSAINEDGVVEANAARVEQGVVYLEYRPPGAEAALTADAH